jgi:5-methylcytosine-specific restriction endonuclease McrA
MPFVEDLSTTARGALSPRRRLAVWERTGGTCVVCERRIDGVREPWIAEHIRALELGGADDLDNMGPAHEACAAVKTQEDHRRAARAKRQKIRHLGAERPRRPLPCGRRSRYKKKISGEVVLRE